MMLQWCPTLPTVEPKTVPRAILTRILIFLPSWRLLGTSFDPSRNALGSIREAMWGPLGRHFDEFWESVLSPFVQSSPDTLFWFPFYRILAPSGDRFSIFDGARGCRTRGRLLGIAWNRKSKVTWSKIESWWLLAPLEAKAFSYNTVCLDRSSSSVQYIYTGVLYACTYVCIMYKCVCVFVCIHMC